MPKHIFAVLALVLTALACNWSDIAPPAAPVIEPSPLPTFAISTLTPIPTETPLPEPTSTPNVPIAWPKDLGVNCRYGPGEKWEAASSITADTITEIKGRTVNTAWWYVVDPLHDGNFCWVAYDVMYTAGNLDTVPIAKEPTASVTVGTVDALVTFTACGMGNAVTFNAAITTNGPTAITYHWEVSGDASSITPDTILQIDESGTYKLTADFFSADCGTYMVKLLATIPNSVSVQKTFTVQAP